MSTTYEEIYNRFTPLIEDVKMLSLSDQDVLKMMKEWLIGATGDYIRCTYDLETGTMILKPSILLFLNLIRKYWHDIWLLSGFAHSSIQH